MIVALQCYVLCLLGHRQSRWRHLKFILAECIEPVAYLAGHLQLMNWEAHMRLSKCQTCDVLLMICCLPVLCSIDLASGRSAACRVASFCTCQHPHFYFYSTTNRPSTRRLHVQQLNRQLRSHMGASLHVCLFT